MPKWYWNSWGTYIENCSKVLKPFSSPYYLLFILFIKLILFLLRASRGETHELRFLLVRLIPMIVFDVVSTPLLWSYFLNLYMSSFTGLLEELAQILWVALKVDYRCFLEVSFGLSIKELKSIAFNDTYPFGGFSLPTFCVDRFLTSRALPLVVLFLISEAKC